MASSTSDVATMLAAIGLRGTADAGWGGDVLMPAPAVEWGEEARSESRKRKATGYLSGTGFAPDDATPGTAAAAAPGGSKRARRRKNHRAQAQPQAQQAQDEPLGAARRPAAAPLPSLRTSVSSISSDFAALAMGWRVTPFDGGARSQAAAWPGRRDDHGLAAGPFLLASSSSSSHNPSPKRAAESLLSRDEKPDKRARKAAKAKAKAQARPSAPTPLAKGAAAFQRRRPASSASAAAAAEEAPHCNQQQQQQRSVFDLHGETCKGSASGGKKMVAARRLAAARFRMLNERLYTTSGEYAFGLFTENPDLFQVYHDGFKTQVERWPVNPVDVIIEWLGKRKRHLVVADLGCGEAQIASCAQQEVLSFDLVACNERVTACDIASLPLKDKTVDIAIFCLALMGTNYMEYLKEARRILGNDGIMKIAEVRSRLPDVEAFIALVESLGFEFVSQDARNQMFLLLEFKTAKQRRRLPNSETASRLLQPCLYKRR